MNKYGIFHQMKSNYAYPINNDTIRITLRTVKCDLKSVKLLYGDPFLYSKKDGVYQWDYDISLMKLLYTTTLFDYYYLDVTPPYKRVKYAFILDDSCVYTSKTYDPFTLPFNLLDFFNFPFIYESDIYNPPNWINNSIMYSIFPDRFYSTKELLPWTNKKVNNKEIYGGNIEGIIGKLDYLSNLGIDSIWFTPIFESKSAHKYDTDDYMEIDSVLGNKKDFRKLVIQSHSKGIRIILDAVLNHIGFENNIFQDVLKKEKESKYYDWFFITNTPIFNSNFDKNVHSDPSAFNYLSFATTYTMPKWNLNNVEAKEYLIGVLEYWVKEFDIDGYRFDVSNELSHEFINELGSRLRKIKKEIFLFGENNDNALPWIGSSSFHGAMNYELTKILFDFLENKYSDSVFTDNLATYYALTPNQVKISNVNLLGCHDTTRVLTRLNNDIDLVKIAFGLLFFQTGIPLIYYGDEVGLEGNNDPDNRRLFNWNEDSWNKNFYNYIKKLITIKKKYDFINNPDIIIIKDSPLILTKAGLNKKITLIINKYDVPCTLENKYASLFDLLSESKINDVIPPKTIYYLLEEQ